MAYTAEQLLAGAKRAKKAGDVAAYEELLAAAHAVREKPQQRVAMRNGSSFDPVSFRKEVRRDAKRAK